MIVQNGVSRRNFVAAGAMLGLGATFGSALSGCSNDEGGEAASKDLVYAGFGGTHEENVRTAFLDAWVAQEEINLTVTDGGGSQNIARMQAMIDNDDMVWDVLGATSITLPQYRLHGLVEEFDYDRIDTSGIPDRFKDPYGVGWASFSHNIFWNTELIPDGLESWQDVWDVEQFPGRRGFNTTPDWTAEAALLADGVDPGSLYPLDLDRMFRSLDRIRPHAVFIDTNAMNNQVAQGDIATGDMNVSRVKGAARDGVPLAWSWNQYLVEMSYWVIPKGAKNQDLAYKMIEQALRPETQTQLPDLFGYSPASTAALSELSDEMLADLPLTEITEGGAVEIDGDWWAENGDETRRRFDDWLIG